MAEPGGLAARFAQGLELGPGRDALRAGGASYSYAWVHQTALRLAGAVAGAGRPAPARAGVLAGSPAAAHTGILAAIYAGAAAVPLNPNFPPGRTAAMIRAAGLDTVIADERGAAVLAPLRDAFPRLRCVPAGPDSMGSGPAPLAAPRPARDHDIAYIMFTSGSTGQPKGVPVSHGNVAHFLDCAQERYQVTGRDVLAQTFEPTFDLFMFGLFMAWSANATLVAAPAAILRRLPEFLAEHQVSLWFSVPGTIRAVRRLGRLSPGALPTLTRSLFCGEALPWDDATAWQAAAPAAVLENLYGPTELTIACTAYRLPPVGGSGQAGDAVNGLVPIGHPHPGLDCLLVDEDLRPARDEGELCVTGPQMFTGYLDPADDTGHFLTHAGRRWYRTGDRARWLPGAGLAYLGRLDYQVKVRGYRVDLLEVEHALRQLGGVRDCAVVALQRDGETELAAAYCGDPAPAGALARQLAATLPGYMVPRTIRHAAALPLNTNGKIDRRALAGWVGDTSVPAGGARGRD